MSYFESENEKQEDYLAIYKDSAELYEIMKEYLKLSSEYEEPLDAKRMRMMAEKCLQTEDCDYQRAFRIMKTALKIMKACNGI